MSRRPWRSTVSSTIRPASPSSETSARTPPSGGFKSAITTSARSAARPSAIARPMPCAPPVTTATLPSSLTGSLQRRKGGRDQDPVLLRVDQRLDLREEVAPLLVRLQLGAAAFALGIVVVRPDVRVGRDCAHVGRERADEVAEVALLDLDPLGLVEADELVQLARVDVVVALLDDHAAILGILGRMALRDRLAPTVFALLGRPMEKKPPIAEARRKLLAAAEGRVLEVGAGTGFNLPHYPAGTGELVLTDDLEGMLRRARRRADRVGRKMVTTQAPVE